MADELQVRDYERGNYGTNYGIRKWQAGRTANRYINNIDNKRGKPSRLGGKMANIHTKYSQSVYMTANAG
ncbi:MAG: hypothetical protein LIP02_04010 [Bacteroidales bacterium]|nr:hypothetical protein [Bacteroidales bacterium]